MTIEYRNPKDRLALRLFRTASREKRSIYSGFTTGFPFRIRVVSVVFFGNGVPLLLLSADYGLLVVAAASIFVLIGVWLSVRIWVMAPQMVALS